MWRCSVFTSGSRRDLWRLQKCGFTQPTSTAQFKTKGLGSARRHHRQLMNNRLTVDVDCDRTQSLLQRQPRTITWAERLMRVGLVISPSPFRSACAGCQRLVLPAWSSTSSIRSRQILFSTPAIGFLKPAMTTWTQHWHARPFKLDMPSLYTPRQRAALAFNWSHFLGQVQRSCSSQLCIVCT